MSTILLIEDNQRLAATLGHNLELEGYEVVRAADGALGLEEATRRSPDLVILDLMLPKMNGFEVLRCLRRSEPDIPVLILSARGDEADVVRGFRLDADQYVTKPFRLVEILERISSLLRRRSTTPASAPEVVRFGDVEVHAASHTVKRAGKPVTLTPRAFALLLALIRRRGRVASRQELLREVWGHRGVVLSRTVDAHIAEIRKKLEDDPSSPSHILTVWKVGYRFEADA